MDSAKGPAPDQTPSHTQLQQATPSSIGGYRIVRILGQGGMGRVYEAFDSALHRPLAIKVLRVELPQRPEARERFLREARAAAALQHDRIIPIWQVGEEGGCPYIAMPLLAGETLEARLKRGPKLDVAETLRISREIAEGLEAAHAKGLIHRDIKPANVWLEAPQGRVKILDFGLARLHEEAEPLTADGQILGTPAYMSPEQAESRPVDARSDLFSLGAVLFELATGRRAFTGDSQWAVLRAVVEHTPPSAQMLDATLPLGLSDLIDRLLAKEAGHRPATARDVADALQQVEHRANLSTADLRTQTTIQKVRPPRRRLRWVVLGILMLAVLAGGILPIPHCPRGTSSASDRATLVQLEELLRQELPQPAKVSCTVAFYRAQKGSGDNVRTLAAGDKLSAARDLYGMVVTPEQNGYLYVLQIDSSGHLFVLFPRNAALADSSGSNPIAAAAAVQIPPSQGFRLDEVTGAENLFVVFSPSPLPEMERWLGTSPSAGPPSPERVTGPLVLKGVSGAETLAERVTTVAGPTVAVMLTGRTYSNAGNDKQALVVPWWFEHVP